MIGINSQSTDPMDLLSPMILLHENGYRALAPSKGRAGSLPGTPEFQDKVVRIGEGDLDVKATSPNRNDQIGESDHSDREAAETKAPPPPAVGPVTRVAVDIDSHQQSIVKKPEFRPASRHLSCAWCSNDATQEAVQHQQNLTVISRCCDDQRCIWLSTEMCERMTA
jgi:hypothetical protein